MSVAYAYVEECPARLCETSSNIRYVLYFSPFSLRGVVKEDIIETDFARFIITIKDAERKGTRVVGDRLPRSMKSLCNMVLEQGAIAYPFNVSKMPFYEFSKKIDIIE